MCVCSLKKITIESFHLKAESERLGMTICSSIVQAGDETIAVNPAVAIGLSGTVKQQYFMSCSHCCRGKPSRACKLSTRLVAELRITWCLFMCTIVSKARLLCSGARSKVPGYLHWLAYKPKHQPTIDDELAIAGGRLNMHG